MRNITLLQAKVEAYQEELDRDPNVIMIGEDIGEMGGEMGQTPGFLKKYGEERIISCAVAESAQASFAVGAAAAGEKVIVEFIISDFSIYAFDGIINQAAKQRYTSAGKFSFPIVFLMNEGHGGGYGPQHSQMIDGMLQNVPGLKIYTPTFPSDYKGLMKYAIREGDPVCFMEPRNVAIRGDVPDLGVEHILEPGRAAIVNAGTDITIISYHDGMIRSLEASKQLKEQGISCEVIDLRTIKPLDEKTIVNSVRKTGRALVVTEAPKIGGVGNQIITLIMEKAFDALKAPAIYLGAKDFPLPFGPGEEFVFVQVSDIIETVKGLVKK